MKTLLFIGPEFHGKTRSSDFILELFRSKYEVTSKALDYGDGEVHVPNLDSLKEYEFDVLVCWQLRISTASLAELNYRNGVFFPMYDSCPSASKVEKWYGYRNFTIISFSRVLYRSLIKLGLNAHYIQYFPPSSGRLTYGDSQKAFYWARRNDMSPPAITYILKQLGVCRLHIHLAPDPGARPLELSEFGDEFELTVSSWYQHRKDLMKSIRSASYFVAPRKKEGIGMSFLEAMAMGRCVVAADGSTMNEYISSGETGLLLDKHYNIKSASVRPETIQEGAYHYCMEGQHSWDVAKLKVFDWAVQNTRLRAFRFYAFLLVRFFRNPLKVLRAILGTKG